MLIGFAGGAGPSNLTTPVTTADAEVSAEALGLVAAAGAAAPDTFPLKYAHLKTARTAAIMSAYFGFIVFLSSLILILSGRARVVGLSASCFEASAELLVASY
jgi:hypothetical protein